MSDQGPRPHCPHLLVGPCKRCDMGFKELTYERLESNNFNNERVGATVTVADGESPDAALERVKLFVARQFAKKRTQEVHADYAQELCELSSRLTPGAEGSVFSYPVTEMQDRLTWIAEALLRIADGLSCDRDDIPF